MKITKKDSKEVNNHLIVEYLFDDDSWVEFSDLPINSPNEYSFMWEVEWPEEDNKEADYISGSIDVENGEVIDFDGCYDLPENVKVALKDMGLKYDENN